VSLAELNIAQVNAEVRRELLRRRIPRIRLYDFGVKYWPVVEPGDPFIPNWHNGAVAEHLEAVVLGQISELLINQPPGTMKSLWLGVFLPAWVWTFWPEFRGIFCSYDGPLATRDSIKCRLIMESPVSDYMEEFAAPAGWSFSKDQNDKTLYKNTREGVRQALGVGSGGTGFRGNLVAVDDPISVEQAYSEQFRKRSIRWWDKTMSNRISDPRMPRRIVAGHRVHDNDLSGHVLKQGTYVHLCLPSEYDPKRSCVTVRKVAGEDVVWRDPRAQEGELLFPQFQTVDFLEAEKTRLGSDGYAGQHNQNPNPPGGSIFKKFWWRFFKIRGRESAGYRRPDGCHKVEFKDDQGMLHVVDVPAIEVDLEDLEEIYMSIDCAFKDKADSSFVVMGVWGRKGKNRYRIARRRAKMSFTRTKAELRALCVEWPQAHKKMVEDKANGTAIIDDLQNEITGIVPRSPGRDSKEARAHAVSPQVESGHVYLLDGEPWLDEYISELATFPNGDNDDQVDETSQALLEYSPSGPVARAAALCQGVAVL
jgi:predicted phage terminase large subunit-like protein